MNTIDQVRLEFHDEGINSHKFYEAYLQESEHGYWVTFAYGRIDGHVTEGTKLQGGALEEAEECFEKLVESKLRKGYLDV